MSNGLSFTDRENLWIQAGGNPSFAAMAAAISTAENGSGDPTLVNSTQDVGLWQIHQPSHPEYTTEWLQNPLNNAKAAVAISNNGVNWKPWVTYQTGAYQQYLNGSGTASLLSFSSSCATSNLQLGNLGPFSLGTVCMDGPLAIGAVFAGIVLGIAAVIVLSVITLQKSSLAKEGMQLANPLSKLTKLAR